MPKWAKIKPGELVELKGRVWLVESLKLKAKGSVAKVTISSSGDRFSRELDANTKVAYAPLHEPVGQGSPGRQQSRWAKPSEAEDPERAKELARQVKARAKAAQRLAVAIDDPTPGEYNVMRTLKGWPVSTIDVHGSWIVPEVDPSTIEAHLWIFHGIDPGVTTWPTTYAEQLALHSELHAKGATHRHQDLTPE